MGWLEEGCRVASPDWDIFQARRLKIQYGTCSGVMVLVLPSTKDRLISVCDCSHSGELNKTEDT